MRIAVYYDDSAFSKKAFKMAEYFSGNVNGELYVVSTITREDPIKHSKLQEIEEEFEASIMQLRSPEKIPYECKLLVSDEEAGEQLVKFAKRKNLDWLYIGTPNKSKLAKLIAGSTSLFIILNSPCPVVTINDKIDLSVVK